MNEELTENVQSIDENEQTQEVVMQNSDSSPDVIETAEPLALSQATSGLVDGVETEVLNDIKEKTNFKKRSEGVIEKAVNAELERREIIVLDQEQKNELAKLKLELNKKAMKEEAKAEHYERKRKAAMLRYGYLYDTYEVEVIDPKTNEIVKETRYKNFTTNRFINKYKEFANFWANLADTTKNIIKKTLKFILWAAIITGLLFAVYGIVKWLISSGITNNLVENVEENVKNYINIGGKYVSIRTKTSGILNSFTKLKVK